jgi:[acyl-carrier-protein] S-malonyltransferase
MTRVALCFPGQGSQSAGMAEGMMDTPVGERLLALAASEGLDLRAALTGPDDALRPTEVAQPAIVFVELVLADALPDGLDVVGVAGHSVGEYAAVSVAGALTAEDAMRLVIRRGREMARMTEGTMAAVLGLDAAVLDDVCAELRASGEVVVVANLNAPGQTVISGTRGAVDAAADLARERGARRVVPLNVSGAFHSPLMAPAAARLTDAIQHTPLHALRVPVVCNVDATVVDEADQLPDRLSRQLEAPVRWMECVARLVDLGADTLVEVGPGAVLSGLARRIAPGTATVNVADRAGAVALAELRTAPA